MVGREQVEWLERFAAARGIRERLELLVAVGLTDRDIAKAMPDAGPRSVRRWRTDGPPTTRRVQRWEPIDDLCATVTHLLANDAFADNESIVEWLRSRCAALDHQRPLDVLAQGGFDEVRAAAGDRAAAVARTQAAEAGRR